MRAIPQLLASLSLLALLPVSATDGSQDAPLATYTLAEGRPVFWDGPFVTQGNLVFGAHSGEDLVLAGERGLIDACEWPGQGPCFRYALDVPASAPGTRLRVAIDSPTHDDKFGFELYSPDGARAGTVCCAPQDSYEVILPDPAPGRWIVKAEAAKVSYASFRMRALLEAPEPAGEPRALLPNLRVEPPLNPTFTMPLETTGLTQAPAEAFGESPSSCLPDEEAESAPVRCLRFDLGLQNVGDGPLDAVFEPLTSGSTTGNLTQRVRWSDGSHVDRPAGTFEWHAAHAHYHLAATATLHLYKVLDDKRPTLLQVGEGRKLGYCLVDTKISEWYAFRQDAQHSAAADCNSQTEPRMGLTRGWTDMYHWYNSGNYVDFGANADGRYVLRGEVDAAGHFLETDERDNVGYALVEVRGEEVRVLERGLGLDPWDPHKTVL